MNLKDKITEIKSWAERFSKTSTFTTLEKESLIQQQAPIAYTRGISNKTKNWGSWGILTIDKFSNLISNEYYKNFGIISRKNIFQRQETAQYNAFIENIYQMISTGEINFQIDKQLEKIKQRHEIFHGARFYDI